MISKLALERIVRRINEAGHAALADGIERDWSSVVVDVEMDEFERVRSALREKEAAKKK